MEQTKTKTGPIGFTARFSNGLNRALDSKTEWTDKVRDYLILFSLIIVL